MGLPPDPAHDPDACQRRGLCGFRDLVRPEVNGGKIPSLIAGDRDVELRAQS